MNRLEKLKELEAELREMLGKASSRSMASLARQYREVLREIDELEADVDESDAIAGIIANRADR